MNNRYVKSILTSAMSILPMIAIVLLLSVIKIEGDVSIVPLKTFDYVALSLGAVVMIVGLGLFQVGASTGLAKVGEYMGSSLSKQTSIAIVIIFSFLLGALITCAEPSILIVAGQVNIPPFLLIGVIAAGVGLFVVIGVIRIIFHGSLKLWYLLYYFIVFALLCLISIDKELQQFLPFIFDAGGITTGSATVPFILSLGAGIAIVRGGRKATEDSFGLVGMASIGPILSMVILLLANRGGFSAYQLTMFSGFEDFGAIFNNIIKALLPTDTAHLGTLMEVFMALVPIIIIFVIYELIFIKLPKKKIGELAIGFLLSYVGLVVFLTGVNSMMAPFGTFVGMHLGQIDNNWVIVLICFVIGLVTVLCEPAVHVLTNQITDMSDGHISKKTVLISLSIGVGIAIGLAAIRTLFDFSILYIVVPGYVLSIVLMFVTPNIYTAMAFDAGGTASGPMSVSFVLPMVIGITYSKTDYGTSSILYYTRSFGVVALIALTPILTVQILGIVQDLKTKARLRVMSTDIDDPLDAEIIHFKKN
ncbi:MAG: DUF1538 domain-containing protein [Bacilli bacterium]|nr:DUF1538 domain-containing protein [Bacilli bacterium]